MTIARKSTVKFTTVLCVARLAYAQGSVSFQPAGTDDWVIAGLNRPVTTGDKLWSDNDGRTELQPTIQAI